MDRLPSMQLDLRWWHRNEACGAGTGMIPAWLFLCCFHADWSPLCSQSAPTNMGRVTIASPCLKGGNSGRNWDVFVQTFGQILDESHRDMKIKKYLQFICRKFRKDIVVPFVPATQGPDLAGFCLRGATSTQSLTRRLGYIREFRK